MYNGSPAAGYVYLTGTVGALSQLHPLDIVCRPLLLIGVPALPAAMYRAADGLRLHPALVAAAAQATLELAARTVGEIPPTRDAALFARLPGGRRALGTARAAYLDMASDLLVRVHRYCVQLCDGTRFIGVVRWSDSSPVIHEPPPDFDLREEALRAVLGMTLIAYATPPIISFRRTPSLEFFRADGTLQLRNFGPFAIEAAP